MDWLAWTVLAGALGWLIWAISAEIRIRRLRRRQEQYDMQRTLEQALSQTGQQEESWSSPMPRKNP